MAKARSGHGGTTDPALQAALAARIGTLWDTLHALLPDVLHGQDAEAVHDARVASRRLRTAMDAAAPSLDAGWYRALHREAKSITRNLGRVRDYDVMLAQLAVEEAGGDERPGRAHLRKRLRRERRQVRKTVRKRLARVQAKRVRRAIRKRFPPLEAPDTGAVLALTGVATAFLGRRAAAFLAHNAVLRERHDAAAAHEARIDAKHLRYALEVFGDDVDGDDAPLLAALRRVQEALGQLHDLDVRIDRLSAERAVQAGRGCKGERLAASLDAALASDRAARDRLERDAWTAWRATMRGQPRARLNKLANVAP